MHCCVYKEPNEFRYYVTVYFLFTYISDYDTTTNISGLNTSRQNENLSSNFKNNKGKTEYYHLMSCVWSVEVSYRDRVH